MSLLPCIAAHPVQQLLCELEKGHDGNHQVFVSQEKDPNTPHIFVRIGWPNLENLPQPGAVIEYTILPLAGRIERLEERLRTTDHVHADSFAEIRRRVDAIEHVVTAHAGEIEKFKRSAEGFSGSDITHRKFAHDAREQIADLERRVHKIEEPRAPNECGAPVLTSDHVHCVLAKGHSGCHQSYNKAGDLTASWE